MKDGCLLTTPPTHTQDAMYSYMNAENQLFKGNTAWYNGTRTPYNGAQLNTAIASNKAAALKATWVLDKKGNPTTGKYIPPDNLMFHFNKALSMRIQTCNTSIGV